MFPAASAAGPPPLFQNVLPEPSSRNELVVRTVRVDVEHRSQAQVVRVEADDPARVMRVVAVRRPASVDDAVHEQKRIAILVLHRVEDHVRPVAAGPGARIGDRLVDQRGETVSAPVVMFSAWIRWMYVVLFPETSLLIATTYMVSVLRSITGVAVMPISGINEPRRGSDGTSPGPSTETCQSSVPVSASKA